MSNSFVRPTPARRRFLQRGAALMLAATSPCSVRAQDRASDIVPDTLMSGSPVAAEPLPGSVTPSPAPYQPPPVVKTSAGSLEGLRVGQTVHYRGIPYAEPPVGALRFRPPRPKARWSGVRRADVYRSVAVQSNSPVGDIEMLADSNEDCLYLNLVVPEGTAPFPVLVWLSSDDNVRGRASLAAPYDTAFGTDGVLVVTLGFRLGAFGFMEMSSLLDDSYAGSGNNGLRDILEALTWIKTNIAAFGGDPGRVTLGGQGTAAELISTLMAAPSGQGLFQQAILQSGGETVQSSRDANALALSFMAASGLQPGNAAQLVRQPAARILAIQNQVIGQAVQAAPFRPVVDGIVLPVRPLEAIAAGSNRSIRVLCGSNRDEMAGLLWGERVDAPIEGNELRHGSVAAVTPRVDEYKAHFQGPFYRHVLNRPSWSELKRRILTAEGFWIPTLRIAEATAASGGAAYMYRFDYRGADPEHPQLLSHGSEMPYVWNGSAAGGPGKAMHAAWVHFIRNGEPGGLVDNGDPWPMYELVTRQVAVFDRHSTLVSDPEAEERRLWPARAF